MFVAGASQWPLAYTAVVKSSLTLLGFALSLLLREIYGFFARRSAPAFLTVRARFHSATERLESGWPATT
jgi:hypothetical protein